MEKNETENPALFNLANLENKTLDYLSKVKAEADRIVADARAEIVALRKSSEVELDRRSAELDRRQAELTRREQELETRLSSFVEEKQYFIEKTLADSRAEGFAAGQKDGKTQGYQQGLEQAEIDSVQKRREEVRLQLSEHAESLIPTLNHLVNEMAGIRQTLLKRWEDNMLQIAGALAWQVMARELPQMKDVPVALLREALELAVGCTSVKIRMNHQDIDELNDQITQLLQETGTLATAEIISDPKMQRGGCVVETLLGIIDQRLDSRLKRIIAELS